MIFSFRGKSVYYDVLGKGNPILFVHGWGGSSESLRRLAVLLSEKHTSILVDLPGFGQSDTPPPEWGTGEYAQVLEALLVELKIKKTDYFGHSFGGALGIYLSAKTDKINRLILCNSSYKRSARRSILARIAKHIFPGNNPPLKMMFYKVFFRNSDLAKYPHVERNFRLIVKEDLSPLVPDVKAKTLIIWGENDNITPISLAEELHSLIRHSKLVIIPNARHGLPLRNPELLVKPIEEFI